MLDAVLYSGDIVRCLTYPEEVHYPLHRNTLYHYKYHYTNIYVLAGNHV